MNSIFKIIRDLLLSTNLNKNPAELVYNFENIVKRIYIKMLKFKIKQDRHGNKMNISKSFGKRYQLLKILIEL